MSFYYEKFCFKYEKICFDFTGKKMTNLGLLYLPRIISNSYFFGIWFYGFMFRLLDPLAVGSAARMEPFGDC